MRNLFPPISDMRCVLRFRLFLSLVPMGVVPNPQDTLSQHHKSLDTAKERNLRSL